MSYVEGNQESGRRSKADRGTGNGHDEQDAAVALDHSRQAKAEVEHLAETIRLASSEWEAVLRQRFRERPYATLAVAVGVGYVIGGGLAPGLLRSLAGTGSRLALGVALQRLMAGTGLDATPESME